MTIVCSGHLALEKLVVGPRFWCFGISGAHITTSSHSAYDLGMLIRLYCIKNNHNKFVRFEFCRRLNYTSNKSRSDLIWSNSTIHPFATTLLNLPNRCLLFCSFRPESVDGAIWANIPLIWRCLQSQAPKSWSGCWDTFRYVIGICKKKDIWYM